MGEMISSAQKVCSIETFIILDLVAKWIVGIYAIGVIVTSLILFFFYKKELVYDGRDIVWEGFVSFMAGIFWPFLIIFWLIEKIRKRNGK
jgi:hypothetical protein